MVGKEIAALRKARGMTQKQLARQVGVGPSAIGMYEQGRRTPPLPTLQRLAAALGVGLDRLAAGAPAAAAAPVAADPQEDAAMMAQALALAAEAAAEGEVPVGCVIACEGRVVGRGRNRRERGRSALAHAEVEAIAQACQTLGGWRLWQCTLYVTLEPCPMCAGAILNARIPRVVYGARDPKAGSCGSVCNLFSMSYNHHPKTEQGLMEAECAAILRAFFQDLRRRRQRRQPGP